MLYLIESHLDNSAVDALQQQLRTSDDLVCLNEGIYCLADFNADKHNIHAMAEHATLRGVSLANRVTPIGMTELITLSVKHPTSVTR